MQGALRVVFLVLGDAPNCVVAIGDLLAVSLQDGAEPAVAVPFVAGGVAQGVAAADQQAAPVVAHAGACAIGVDDFDDVAPRVMHHAQGVAQRVFGGGDLAVGVVFVGAGLAIGVRERFALACLVVAVAFHPRFAACDLVFEGQVVALVVAHDALHGGVDHLAGLHRVFLSAIGFGVFGAVGLPLAVGGLGQAGQRVVVHAHGLAAGVFDAGQGSAHVVGDAVAVLQWIALAGLAVGCVIGVAVNLAAFIGGGEQIAYLVVGVGNAAARGVFLAQLVAVGVVGISPRLALRVGVLD